MEINPICTFSGEGSEAVIYRCVVCHSDESVVGDRDVCYNSNQIELARDASELLPSATNIGSDNEAQLIYNIVSAVNFHLNDK